jgi:sodium-dependent dicarboxylate transporter 2/3/5
VTGRAWYVLAIVAGAALLGGSGLADVDAVGIFIWLALAIGGVLPLQSLLAGFGSEAVVLVGAMMVVAEGWRRVGALRRFGVLLLWGSSGGEGHARLSLAWAGAIMAALLKSTAATVGVLPVVARVAARRALRPSRLYLIAALGVMAGGLLTLIGTSGNLVANSVLAGAGQRGFGFLELAPLGVGLALILTVYAATLAGRLALALMVAAAFFAAALAGAADIAVAAVAAAGVLVLGRCLTAEDAYGAIRWKVLILLAGAVPLGVAIGTSGLGTAVAGLLPDVGSAVGWRAALAALVLATTLLAQVLSNVPATAVMTSVAIHLAAGIGLPTQACVAVVRVAALCTPLTPLASKPAVLVREAGGYRASDYLRPGAPFAAAAIAFAVLAAPALWPGAA